MGCRLAAEADALEGTGILPRRELPLVRRLVAEDPDEDHPGDEAADVREEGDASGLLGDAERADPADELEEDPDADHDPGRDEDDRDEDAEKDQRADVALREEDDVGAEHAGDGAAGADQRHGARRVDEDLGQSGDDTADQVEDRVLVVSERVLDVVAEDPEEEHVEADVRPTTVHELRGQERVELMPVRDLVRDRAPAQDKIFNLRVRKRQHVEEDEGVEHDDGVVDDRREAAAVVLVADRDHAPLLPAPARRLSMGRSASPGWARPARGTGSDVFADAAHHALDRLPDPGHEARPRLGAAARGEEEPDEQTVDEELQRGAHVSHRSLPPRPRGPGPRRGRSNAKHQRSPIVGRGPSITMSASAGGAGRSSMAPGTGAGGAGSPGSGMRMTSSATAGFRCAGSGTLGSGPAKAETVSTARSMSCALSARTVAIVWPARAVNPARRSASWARVRAPAWGAVQRA